MSKLKYKLLFVVVAGLICMLPALASNTALEFKPAILYSVGTSPDFVLTADFNGDGKPDLAVRNHGTSNVSVLLGNGDGTFRNAPSIGLVGSLVAGDFTGDHKDDLIVDDGSSLSLYVSKGDGTFGTGVRIANSSGTPLVADFNLDNLLDIADGSTILLGNGNGTFQAPKDIGTSGGVFVADVNADGKPDLLASGVMLGNGDGTFQAPIPFPWPGSCVFLCQASISNLVSADLDGDGNLDFAMGYLTRSCDVNCSPYVGLLLYFFGNGDGTFRKVTASSDFGLPRFLLAADFNRDGTSDLAVAPTVESGSPLIYFLIGGEVIQYDLGSGPVYLIAADLNGDGFPDIVTANYTDAQISVVLNSPPDFSLSPTAAELSVQRGQQGGEELLIGSHAGFSDAVSLSCSVSGPPPMPTCSVTPVSVLPDDTAQLTVNTSAYSASVRGPGFLCGPFLASLLPLGLIGCAFVSSFDRRRLASACFLLITATVLTVGCGSGGGISPPPMSYAITIAGASGAIQHSTTVQLTVQ